ncbi:DNA internalization-related competence protein ComEC/Rec2 [Anaeromicropila herbilytica]|uniref:DNA internalization-related competence protein ComEC/Rec2 n=1 Tax=Anaeromicropila herbilytica TaxID=2785025 RepID=A0A7R7IF35_9FIRM|nr:DNA internalization-related competence protein ComEC/Rec2 [Anaeromicropila herbilytica]BCN31748.1 DNA internalization-related competence protein ComEC/Rec2 [Anaeromicropila herbilytica]
MIKRPLVWIFAAYVLGVLLARINIRVRIFIILGIFLFVIFFMCIKKISNSYIDKSDRFVILLPAIMYLGIFLTQNQLSVPALNNMYNEKVNGSIIGTLYQMEKKGEKTTLYVKNNTIQVNAPIEKSKGYDLNKKKSNQNQSKLNNLDQTNYNKLIKQGSKVSNKNNKNNFYKTFSHKIIIYSKESNNNLKIGNKLQIKGQINILQHNTNPGQFDEYDYYRMIGIDYKVYSENIEVINSSYSRYLQFLYEIKGKMVSSFERILNRKEAGIISAMLLGDKSELDEEINALYQENGISHIIAISGLNVSLIGLFIYQLLRKLHCNIKISVAFSIIFIYSFGALTNFSVSTNRAVVMLIVSYIAILIGRTYDLYTSLALSALIILIQNPMQLYDVGFLLSFGAVLGIALFLPPFKMLFQEDEVLGEELKEVKEEKESKIHEMILDAMKEGILLSVAVNFITTPVLLFYFYEVPTYSIIVNLLILPFSSLLLLIAFLGGIFGCFSITIGTFFIGGVHYILLFYEWLCRSFVKLPFHTILVGKPKEIYIVIYCLLIVGFLVVINKFPKKKVCFMLLFTIIIFIPSRESGLFVTFLDVGQGDGIIMRTPSRTTYMIDGGSTSVTSVGKYRIEKYLKYKGIGVIDYAIMTHADDDHISGLEEMLADGEIEIKHLVMPNTALKDEAYMGLIDLARQKQIPIQLIQKGDSIRDGKVQITCLHPSEDYETESRNAYSTVLSVKYIDFDLLLTGDVAEDGEDALLKSGLLKDYDVLKVAHHGSKYTTSQEILDIIKPEYSIISCGKRNRYGHPHEELLERLEKMRSNIYITMDQGAITIWTDGKNMNIEGYVE